MRIPRGDFGFQPLSVAPTPAAPPGAFIGGDGLGKLGRALEGVAEGMWREEVRKQREEEEIADRLDAAERMSSFEIDSDEIISSHIERVRNGELQSSEATNAIAAALMERQSELVEGAGERVKRGLEVAFKAPMRRAVIGASRSLREFAKEQQRTSVLAAEDVLSRIGMSDPDRAVSQFEALLDNAGGAFSPELVEQKRQQFRERTWFSFYQRGVLNAEASPKALDTIAQAIASSSKLDPDKATILLDRVQSAKDRLQARAQADRSKREAQVGKAIADTEGVILKGYPADPETLRDIATGAKGTPLAGDAERLLRLNSFVARFVNASPVTMEQELARLDKEMREPGAKVTGELIEMRDKLGTLFKNTRTQLMERPLEYANARGLVRLEPLNWMDPQSIAGQIRDRVNVARGLQRQFGSPMRIMLPEEGEAVQRALSKATPDQKRDFFRTLSDTIADVPAYAGVMQELAADSPVTALAGMIASRPDLTIRGGLFSSDRTYTARKASDLMLAGEALLNPTKGAKTQDGAGKPMAMPAENLMNGEFATTYDAAFAGAPQARSAAYQAAKAVYAALSAEAGDFSGVLDSKRWKTAAQLATGGAARVNGGAIILPWGMDEAALVDRVARVLSSEQKAGRLPGPLEQMLRAPLENAGDGTFRLRRGTGYWTDKSGAPYRIDIYKPLSGSGTSGTFKAPGASGKW